MKKNKLIAGFLGMFLTVGNATEKGKALWPILQLLNISEVVLGAACAWNSYEKSGPKTTVKSKKVNLKTHSNNNNMDTLNKKINLESLPNDDDDSSFMVVGLFLAFHGLYSFITNWRAQNQLEDLQTENNTLKAKLERETKAAKRKSREKNGEKKKKLEDPSHSEERLEENENG